MADIGLVCRVHACNEIGGTMNTLFCTPEQGLRLEQLLQDVKSDFYWLGFNGSFPFYYPVAFEKPIDTSKLGSDSVVVPALTLQELRDVAKGIKRKEDDWSLVNLSSMLYGFTAPELAAWVIARLEEES
jgi:hypothetical protein